MVTVFKSTQKLFAKNNNNGLGKGSFKGLLRNTLSSYVGPVKEFLALSSFLNSQ